MAKFTIPYTLPDWFNNMSNKGFLNSKDLALLFGGITKDRATKLADKGKLPPHDKVIAGPATSKGDMRSKMYLWKKETIESFIKERHDES